MSSPLRLELAANRTSSGHTVSQNRSRPEDHLTLALGFCSTHRGSPHRGRRAPTQGRTRERNTRAQEWRGRGAIPHASGARACPPRLCAARHSRHCCRLRLMRHLFPSRARRAAALRTARSPREQAAVRQADCRGCAAADLGSQAVRLLRTERHKNLGPTARGRYDTRFERGGQQRRESGARTRRFFCALHRALRAGRLAQSELASSPHE